MKENSKRPAQYLELVVELLGQVVGHAIGVRSDLVFVVVQLDSDAVDFHGVFRLGQELFLGGLHIFPASVEEVGRILARENFLYKHTHTDQHQQTYFDHLPPTFVNPPSCFFFSLSLSLECFYLSHEEQQEGMRISFTFALQGYESIIKETKQTTSVRHEGVCLYVCVSWLLLL